MIQIILERIEVFIYHYTKHRDRLPFVLLAIV